jgi:hypothetical protein
MLTTSNNQSLNFYVASPTDSTVYVNPGVAQIGPYIMDFRGGHKTFVEMTDWTSQNGYQYSVLCLQNSYNFPDMTSMVFTPVDSTAELVSPRIGDSTNLKALGLFLFHSDGTHITLTLNGRIQ